MPDTVDVDEDGGVLEIVILPAGTASVSQPETGSTSVLVEETILG